MEKIKKLLSEKIKDIEKIKEILSEKNRVYIICLAVFCISGGILLHKYISEKDAQDKFESLAVVSTEETTEIQEEEETVFTYLGVENPGKVIDWEALWEENEDIYAWIYIPNTNIDYPILQHPTDDMYYLEHNLDGSSGLPGCIYTEKINEKNFTDHNTLIYGHNMRNGTMFKDVHKFAESDFFEENRYVFIYTPEELLIYDIYAAYRFTDAHILYSYDCVTEDGFSSYLEMVQENYGASGNFRDVEVTGEDHVITLSTCVSGQDDKRQLLQAVLVEYNETQADDGASMDEATETEE